MSIKKPKWHYRKNKDGFMGSENRILEKDDKPEPGKVYALTGGPGARCIANVIRGQTVSLGTTNEGLVSFAIGLAPAAGSSRCPPSQEKLVWLASLYIVLLLLFPSFTTLVTGVLILSLVGIF